ncbi:hypothetical protein MRX96_044577 [Rhipicephalus microplus]
MTAVLSALGDVGGAAIGVAGVGFLQAGLALPPPHSRVSGEGSRFLRVFRFPSSAGSRAREDAERKTTCALRCRLFAAAFSSSLCEYGANKTSLISSSCSLARAF